MRYVVVDIDGTLSNLSHRLHLVRKEKPEWDLFFKQAADDTVNEWCKELINSLWNNGIKILLVSGRPESIRTITKRWLSQNGIHYDKLFLLRGVKDYTPDDQLKREWGKKFGFSKILFVVDDRTKVVQMWRDEGATCLQCDRWEEYSHRGK
jgi:hypothetical protein